MPEVERTTIVHAPPEEVWNFVKDINNWAPYVRGYQGHEVVSDTDSTWTLKGDVGILSRTVRFNVHIDEWVEGERVSFSLKGINESVDGHGRLVAAPAPEGTQLTFVLSLKAGGMTGPMVNAMLGPMLRPIAEEFARRVARQVEALATSAPRSAPATKT